VLLVGLPFMFTDFVWDGSAFQILQLLVLMRVLWDIECMCKMLQAEWLVNVGTPLRYVLWWVLDVLYHVAGLCHFKTIAIVIATCFTFWVQNDGTDCSEKKAILQFIEKKSGASQKEILQFMEKKSGASHVCILFVVIVCVHVLSNLVRPREASNEAEQRAREAETAARATARDRGRARSRSRGRAGSRG
jgi:hypothetical protein